MTSPADLMLADAVASFYDDPYGFVMFAFDWGEGSLRGFDGPDVWQRELLIELGGEIKKRRFDGITPVDPMRFATASGHGIGKSALTAWLILFVMSTRPNSKGVVTANTGDQLRTKTWAELSKWKSHCITGHWFELTASSLMHNKFPNTWRVDAQTCREENSEAFAGLHAADSTPWYLFDEACHDDITEVMTESGWVLFKDVTRDTNLLTMDILTKKAYYDRPTHLHVSNYTGDMITVDNRGCSFSVTPNHRMLFESRKVKQLQFQEAGEVRWNNKKIMRHVEWEGTHVSTHMIPHYNSPQKHYPARLVSMDDWCELLGWFITEGHTTKQRDCKGGQPSSTVITQKQDHYTNEIENCVKRMGFRYIRSEIGIFIYDVALTAYLNVSVGKGFDGKRVPDYIFNLQPMQINRIMDAAVKGDGYVKGNRRILYTSSKSLAEDYNRLAILSGLNSTIHKRSLKGNRNWIVDHWATSSCDGYTVSLAKPTHIDCGKLKPTRTHYEGKVYCATIGGGVLYTRRNGRTMWSGNSAVPDKIWEVAEGGLTDGEPMFFAFGNPTRNTGRFKGCFLGPTAERWITKQVDSRTSKMTNKILIEAWKNDYGEDSDFFKVRVRGVFPSAGDMQFLDGDTVRDAMTRGSGRYLGDDPLICGIDIARGGDDDCRIGFRRGKDAKSERCYRIAPEDSKDSMRVVSKIILVLDRHKPDVTFLDATGLGGPIGDRLRQLGYHVMDVHFGGDADNKKLYVNKTAEMGNRLREWLIAGGAIPDDQKLETELTCREFWHNDKDQLVLERKKDIKKRLGVSPDWADQIYLTFAHAVPKRDIPRDILDRGLGDRDRFRTEGYDPMDIM